MQSAVIVVDNLRIGGFQRLALDQSYGLSDLGYSVKLIVLAEVTDASFHSLHMLEVPLIIHHRIEVVYAGETHLAQMKILKASLKNRSNYLLMCHSLRGTVLIRLVQLGKIKRKKFATTIHQLPSLSEKGQRWRRILYAQFSDLLFAYSESVKMDWQQNISNQGRVAEMIFGKPITVLRNGIYLERLPKTVGPIELAVTSNRPRLIYLGRNAIWKGLGTYLKLLDYQDLDIFDFLLMVPSTEGIPMDLLKRHEARIEILVGMTISDLKICRGDVHIYPTNYGEGVNLVESVSLNVLEFAAIGVPSVISHHGSATWPELLEAGVLNEVDWLNMQDVSIGILSASQFVLETKVLESLREQISILSNLKTAKELLVLCEEN